MKTYRIHAPSYRNGVYYETGAEVVLDKGEKPHPDWLEVKGLPPAQEPKKTPKAERAKRERLFDKDIL